MQTLGLASEQKPTDGMLKRLFWPTIENQYDADLVAQQGFWVCVVVAALSLIVSALSGHILIGLLVALTFGLGGCGVRERSIAAAALVFACYLLDRVLAVEGMMLGTMTGAGNPVMGLVALMLLFANVRATLLSQRWSRNPEHAAEAGELPERSSGSIADSLPARVWPAGKFVFYPLAGVLILLTLLSMLGLPLVARRLHQTPPPSAEYDAPTQ